MREVDADRDLLVAAVRDAGAIAREGFQSVSKSWEKSKGNPVTETDLAVDKFLKERLRGARSDYGWLSEETADTPERLGARRLFIVDPIDGTLSFIKRKHEFTICACVVDNGVPIAAVIYNPMTEEMFAAAQGRGATLNDAPIEVSARAELPGCRILVARDVIEHPAWPQPWPAMDVGKRASIAYRMALVANGTYDAMMALSSKYEWDTAAGALIVQEAGGLATTHTGAALPYNQPTPTHRSLVCAGPALHAAILERTAPIRLP
ncbi:MAG: 3'(2'),5'-bisphosphate nucleotidase CysQ [Alphaproteobacteria bacterium]|nr:3'(2'),5'-bisphosphate nucleotidase CysQ [Alphaproteobacteria bacterium]